MKWDTAALILSLTIMLYVWWSSLEKIGEAFRGLAGR